MNYEAIATLKGCALIAAIDTGMLPDTGDAYDTAQFDEFWKCFLQHVKKLPQGAEATKEKTGRYMLLFLIGVFVDLAARSIFCGVF